MKSCTDPLNLKYFPIEIYFVVIEYAYTLLLKNV